MLFLWSCYIHNNFHHQFQVCLVIYLTNVVLLSTKRHTNGEWGRAPSWGRIRSSVLEVGSGALGSVERHMLGYAWGGNSKMPLRNKQGGATEVPPLSSPSPPPSGCRLPLPPFLSPPPIFPWLYLLVWAAPALNTKWGTGWKEDAGWWCNNCSWGKMAEIEAVMPQPSPGSLPQQPTTTGYLSISGTTVNKTLWILLAKEPVFCGHIFSEYY